MPAFSIDHVLDGQIQIAILQMASLVGFEDPWTCSQNWILKDLGDTEWSDLFESIDLHFMQQSSKGRPHHVSSTEW